LLYFQNKDAFGDVLESGKLAMADAHFVVALVTPALFEGAAFDLIEAAKSMGKTIIPVLVQSIGLAGTGLEGLRALPSNGLFIFPSWPNADAAWLDVANGLKMALKI
jgi:hypothetical protein